MDERIANRILELASAQGAGAAEVFLRASTATVVEVKDCAVDAFERAREQGAGLRVLIDDRMGFAYTTDLSDAALRELARSAVTNAGLVAPDRLHSLPTAPTAPYGAVDIFDPAIADLAEDEMIERVVAMERAAYSLDSRVNRTRKASGVFSSSGTLIRNTTGARVSYQGTACSASLEIAAEDKGESQAGSDYDVSRFLRALRMEETGHRAARRALDLLGARSIDTVRAPAILEASVAQEFLGVLAGGFSAENVQKKRSLFLGRLGTEIASAAVTIRDDGLLKRGLGTAPADDEAVPTTTKTIVDKGRLNLFLHNTYTANKDKTASTGNGMRGGFSGLPGVGVTNLYLEPGESSLDALVGSLSRGLLVTDVMGMHTANPISGDFSVGATGFWIEKGARAFPVREITIAGNIIDLLKNIASVGADLRFSGRIGSPSLLIAELSIGGR